ISHEFSLVRQRTLLGRPDPDPARADVRSAGGAAEAVLKTARTLDSSSVQPPAPLFGHAGVNERIDQHPDGLVEQLAALPHRLRLGHPATQWPAAGHPEKAYGRGDHGHSILLEAPARTRHVRRGGDQHDTFDTLRLEHRRTVHRIFPGGATALLLPADRRGEIAL